jgi:hypothetical protein
MLTSMQRVLLQKCQPDSCRFPKQLRSAEECNPVQSSLKWTGINSRKNNGKTTASDPKRQPLMSPGELLDSRKLADAQVKHFAVNFQGSGRLTD